MVGKYIYKKRKEHWIEVDVIIEEKGNFFYEMNRNQFLQIVFSFFITMVESMFTSFRHLTNSFFIFQIIILRAQ